MAGSAVRRVVLPILVFQLTGSASQTVLLLVIEAVPYLLFGLVAAAIADRVNRRTLMVICNIVSAVAVASMPLATTSAPPSSPTPTPPTRNGSSANRPSHRNCRPARGSTRPPQRKPLSKYRSTVPHPG